MAANVVIGHKEPGYWSMLYRRLAKIMAYVSFFFLQFPQLFCLNHLKMLATFAKNHSTLQKYLAHLIFLTFFTLSGFKQKDITWESLKE